MISLMYTMLTMSMFTHLETGSMLLLCVRNSLLTYVNVENVLDTSKKYFAACSYGHMNVDKVIKRSYNT